MRNFDFYEFAGIIVPGVILITSSLLAIIEPEVLLDMKLGASFIFIVVAYVCGHIIQSFGNLFEFVWWKAFGGMPTDWVQKKSDPILSKDQRDKLISAIEKNEDIERFHISEMERREWSLLIRSLYVAIQARGQTERIERFNGNYGMLRGVVVSCLISGLIMLLVQEEKEIYGAVLIFLGMLSSIRMHRFAKYYAKELFLQYIKCS